MKRLLPWMLWIAAMSPVLAHGAEITGLSWGANGALTVATSAPVTYQVERKDKGLKLRLLIAKSTLASGVTNLGSQGIVKGAYPYQVGTGDEVAIDLLLTQAGSLAVTSNATGLIAAVQTPTSGGQVATAAPAPAGPAAITGISYSALAGNRIQIRLNMTSPVTPKAFRLLSPPAIVLDFPGTTVTAAQNSVNIGVGVVNRVTAVSTHQRARVVVNLAKIATYSTFVGHQSVTLIVQNPTAIAANAGTTVQFAPPAPVAGAHSLTDVTFHRGPEGDGRVTVSLSDPNVGINITRRNGQILVDFLHTDLPHALQRQLNVTDFATPVQTVDTFARGGDVRMVITPTGTFEQLAYQTGHSFTVDIKPESAKEQQAGRKYTGRKISMNFDKISVRGALQVLADFTHRNFVTSNDVTGNLTLRLENVPWDQALNIILQTKGLAMRQVGNVIMVGPQPAMAAQEKARLQAEEESAKLEPLESVLIRINYAKASDIASLLKSIKPIGGSAGASMPFSTVSYGKQQTESNSLLSPRGQVTVDNRTNSLLVQDVPEKIDEIRALIAKLDQPVPQVLIDARLVEATDDFTRSLGVRFGNTTQGTNGSEQYTQVPNLGGITTSSGTDTYNVDLPSTGSGTIPPGTIGLTIAKLGTNDLLNLELSALQTEGKGKIISSPRVITANEKEATIEQGQEQFFNLGFGQSQIKKAVLGLDVTPQITPDHRVILTVSITDDSFTDAVAGTLNTKKITTEVLLDNGQTVVIGGIYTRNSLNTVDKVPFFGDLPLLGWLFRDHAVSDQRDELLIFLTPKILSASLNLG